MIVLSAKELTKSYGTDVILDKVSFHINKGERVGIIGVNGAGKTGDDGDDGDDGESRRLLERYDALQEKFKERGGYTYRSEMMGILSSMAFGEDSYGKKISTLSGGEKTRLALACLLMKKPDILLLDEPTNHLDIGTLKWLEQYLKSYKGTIILVSHDRYFLDETVTRIFEVENHKLSIYEGDYSFYATERKKRREAEMKISFRADFQSGRDVLEAGDVSKSFGYGAGRTELFRHVDLDIKRGERVCIVGANGIGKTTLLKILMGEISCNTGRIKIGYNVKFGYYDQGQQLLNGANTVIEEVRDSYGLYSDGEIRNILGRFMFRGEDVFLKVGALSGGEKARLSLPLRSC